MRPAAPGGVAARPNPLTPSEDGAGFTSSGAVPVWMLRLTAIATVVNVFLRRPLP
jgi:hypothetical protein